jgi:hypothetical protein
MKQTVEEVAREAAEDCYECHYDDSLEMRLVKEAFIYGAEWQSKQSPWISVKEGLPEKNTGVFFTVEWKDSRKGYFVGLYYGNGQWESDNRIFLQDSPLYRITHYMPIPSFDDILEANRDVLERKRERRLNMEVNNGIIIDGVLHELCYGTCDKCSLRNRMETIEMKALRIKNILNSLEEKIESGNITIREAAIELHKAGWINYIDIDTTKKLLGLN